MFLSAQSSNLGSRACQ